MNRTREQWAVIDAKFCATQNSATANWHLIQDAQKDIAELHRERDALLAERDALQRALDRQVPLHDAIQRAAGELPDGWEIRLCVEHHAGWVELIGPDGTEDFATNNERLDYTVIDALEHALQGAQP